MTHPETERYFTPKLGIAVPSIDDEMSAMRPAWERLDQAYSGAVIVNPGVIPDESVLYDGCLVAERTTGIVWRAQRNAAGVFERRYIKYPWRISIAQTTNANPSGAAFDWYAWGYQSFEGGTVNAGSETLVNNRVMIPVTGIYQGQDYMKWEATANNQSHRGHCLWINDNKPGGWGTNANPDPTQDGEQSAPCVYNGASTSICKINRKFNKGDSICAGIWHTSAGAIMTTHRIQLALVRAVG